MSRRKVLPKGNSKLAKWCRREHMTASQLAYRIDMSYSATLNYLKDQTDPSYVVPPPEAQKAIYLLSDGLFVPNDFVRLSDWKAELDVMGHAGMAVGAVL